ncbi:hypothetical protein NA56DRAFT_708712 [Hyaloscypha hepaticicola]|uniref:Uncharacterized protein n=1 Tax=Hyaloscypha hepaticicola TaxID=2082293 RepID=A0A2J6PR47_9HELO|nr:hypothetical protein NA56DRAFT_708712 [Hyaloscypha hepaticicola]
MRLLEEWRGNLAWTGLVWTGTVWPVEAIGQNVNLKADGAANNAAASAVASKSAKVRPAVQIHSPVDSHASCSFCTGGSRGRPRDDAGSGVLIAASEVQIRKLC